MKHQGDASANHKRASRHAPGLIFACLALLVSQIASARLDVDEAEQYRRIERETLERQQRQQSPDVRLPRETPLSEETLDLPDEIPCFEIRTFVLDGERAGDFPWAQEYLDQYAGRCIGLRGINLLVRHLTAEFVSRGLITTRIGISEQDLFSSTLRLAFIPGVIRAYRFADADMHGSWRSAFPGRPGDLLDLRDLEQGLEQMKRVPSQDVDIEILPGERAGESDIVIALKRDRPRRLSLTVDDAGNPATGRYQGTLALQWGNPLALNDLLSLNIGSDLKAEGDELGSRSAGLRYSVPWGYWTFNLGASDYRYHQTVAGANEDFRIRGHSESADSSIERVLHRDRAGKTGLRLRVAKRRSRSHIEDVEILAHRRNVTSAELALIHRHHFGPSQLDITLAHRQGVPWLDGQTDAPSLASDAPTFEYRLQTLDVALQKSFVIGAHMLQWRSELRAQYSQDRLYASEYFAIGGRHTVRGYDGEQALASEHGAYWRNELSWQPLPGSPHIFAGIDFGHVAGPGVEGIIERTLAGVVLGLRGDYYRIGYEIFAGWPLNRPRSVETSTPALGFMLNYQPPAF